ncbi:MAG: hypothetical protein K1X88_34660 [Nannocystaceae bacterium]|nr:hypothetical protein [Nannocystaceae bacterium]
MLASWRISVLAALAAAGCSAPSTPRPATAPLHGAPPQRAATTRADPSATPRPVAPGDAQPCTRTYGEPVDAAAITSLSAAAVATVDAVDRRSAAGTRLVIEGWPVHWHACAPCPDAAACKPCESYAVLASTPAAGIKQPVTAEHDLWIMMREPASLLRGTRYRVVVDVCAGPSPVGDTPHLEWRGAAAVR